MASLKVLLVALVALLLATCATASQRQPLFGEGSSAIPQRFQEMMAQRRHLTQTPGRYGSPSPSPTPSANRSPSPSPTPSSGRYGTYGVYGR